MIISRLRKRTVRIAVVGLMLATMLPVIGAPYSSAADRPAAQPDLEWLRRQLRLPLDDAYERAVEEALASRPTSLAELVEAFLSAYGTEVTDFEPVRSLGLSPIPFGQFITGRFLQTLGQSVLEVGRAGKVSPIYRFCAPGLRPSGGPIVLSAAGAFSELVPGRQLIRQIQAARPLGP